MRCLWTGTAALCLASLVSTSVGAEKPGDALRDLKKKPTCQAHGTKIDFVDTPSEAAQLAKKAGKLVLVLHVSGNFEDPRFT